MRTVCKLHLANGWTVSVSESDTPPAMCSVAAWPTALDNQRLTWKDWFPWPRGAIDKRCFTLEDVRRALAKVGRANAPR